MPINLQQLKVSQEGITLLPFISSLSPQVTPTPSVLDPQSHCQCLDRPQDFGEKAGGAARVREAVGLGKQRLTGADHYLLLLLDQCNGQKSSCWGHLPVNPSLELPFSIWKYKRLWHTGTQNLIFPQPNSKEIQMHLRGRVSCLANVTTW